MDYTFLLPLLIGFASNLASAFTAAYSRRWGERWGSRITAILRNVLGIPLWALGFLLAVRTPRPSLFTPGIFITLIAWLLILAGAALILAALVAIRQRAALPSIQDQLVQNGLYAYVRHPIHSGTFLEFVGLFLLIPTFPVALACLLGTVWILLQTKCEEIDLLQRLPGYQEYMQAVPRFLPRLRYRR